MDLRPDDDIRQAPLRYLGPKGFQLPVHLTYAQLGVGSVTSVIGMAVAWAIGLPPGWGIAAAIIATGLISQAVSYDRPFRKVVRTILTDWRRTSPPAVTKLPAPPKITIGRQW